MSIMLCFVIAPPLLIDHSYQHCGDVGYSLRLSGYVNVILALGSLRSADLSKSIVLFCYARKAFWTASSHLSNSMYMCTSFVLRRPLRVFLDVVLLLLV